MLYNMTFNGCLPIFTEDVPLVEFMYLVFTHMLDACHAKKYIKNKLNEPNYSK